VATVNVALPPGLFSPKLFWQSQFPLPSPLKCVNDAIDFIFPFLYIIALRPMRTLRYFGSEDQALAEATFIFMKPDALSVSSNYCTPIINKFSYHLGYILQQK
jgi:hypothetical protein